MQQTGESTALLLWEI